MTNTPTLPPAGWHPDPELPATQRYWDGSQWTEQRAPLGQQRQKASDGLVAAGYIFALLIPFIGFIIGFILLGKDRTGAGIASILISIVAFFVLWPMLILGGTL